MVVETVTTGRLHCSSRDNKKRLKHSHTANSSDSA